MNENKDVRDDYTDVTSTSRGALDMISSLKLDFKLDSVENKSSDARRLDIYRFVIFSLSRVRKSELFIQ